MLAGCALLVSWALLGSSFALANPSIESQVWSGPADPDALVDDDLLTAIRRLGLVSWWTDTSAMDESVAFLQVLDRTDLAVRRGEIVTLGEAVVRDRADLTVAGLALHSARRHLANAQKELEAVDSRLMALSQLRESLLVTEASLSSAGHPGSIDAAERVRQISAAEATALGRVLDRLVSARDTAEAEVDLATATVSDGVRTMDALVAARQDMRGRARTLATELIELRAVRLVPGPDLPLVAIDAYRTGASFGASCGISWTTLAGIGWIESQHGTYHGAHLVADGSLSDPIIGIRLDGSRSAVVADSDNGRLDGDASYDRAVGPMQFIPSTWNRHAIDGDANGATDPQNLHDAAATAAAYLCRVRAPGASLRSRLLGYNNSDAYVSDVQRSAARWADLQFPDFDAD